MTPAELDSQLHHLRRVLRPTFFGGAVLAAWIDGTIVSTTLRAYPPSRHDPTALKWHCIGFVAGWVVILAW